MTAPVPPDANGLREAVLSELGICPFKENVGDASMCVCGLPAINHDTFAEQIVLSDHPAIGRLLAASEAAPTAGDQVLMPPGETTREWNVLDNGEPYLQPWTEDEDEARSYSNCVTGPLVSRTRTCFPDYVSQTYAPDASIARSDAAPHTGDQS